MVRLVERSVVVLICLVVAATLVIGVYATVARDHILKNAVGTHRGRQIAAVSAESVCGRGDSAGAPNWIAYEGTVLEYPTGLAVETDDGEIIAFGVGPGKRLAELGFTLHHGDHVSAQGVHEAGEFELTQLVNHATGESIILRDETGRSLLGGKGRRRRA